ESGVTTITYAPPVPFGPYTPVFYSIAAYDQHDNLIERVGSVTTPVLPLEFFLTETPELNQWIIREIRGPATGAAIANALAIVANPEGAPSPEGVDLVIENYTAPYFNLSD